jgi:uncharacterized membrane protein YtjA (UPF0391 family)
MFLNRDVLSRKWPGNTRVHVLERLPHPGTIGVMQERARSGRIPPRRNDMLRWALAFFIIALVAAILGFGGIAVAAAGIAKILFFIFLVLFLVALLGGLVRRA